MTEAKHTPGPWKAEMVKGWGGDFCITIAEASKPIFKAIKPDAYYTDWPEGSEPGSKILSTSLAEKQGRYVATPEVRKRLDEIEEANARLIAAAPELLEALIEAEKKLVELEHMVGGGDDEVYVEGAILNARAAIAKATGN